VFAKFYTILTQWLVNIVFIKLQGSFEGLMFSIETILSSVSLSRRLIIFPLSRETSMFVARMFQLNTQTSHNLSTRYVRNRFVTRQQACQQVITMLLVCQITTSLSLTTCLKLVEFREVC
jgi:hypothetical protein